jgi:hypothetical protein
VGRSAAFDRQQADRARAEYQRAVAGSGAGGQGGAQRVAARFDQGSAHRVDAVGQCVQRRRRHGQLLGERAGASAADADLLAVGADVLEPAPAAAAPPAAEHGVAGDPAPEPGVVDAVAERGHRARPLVAQPQRVVGVAVVQVLHLAGEELDVGAAHADPFDVHDDFARLGPGRLDQLDGRLAGPGQHQ